MELFKLSGGLVTIPVKCLAKGESSFLFDELTPEVL